MKKRGVVGRINSKHGGREREREGFQPFSAVGHGTGLPGACDTPLRSFFSTLLLFLTNLIHISTLLDRVNHGGKIDQLVAILGSFGNIVSDANLGRRDTRDGNFWISIYRA